MTLFLAVALVFAAEPADLRRPLAHGVVVNWTDGVVEVEAGSYRAGAQATKAVEQSARIAVDERLADALGDIEVTGEIAVHSLLDDPDLGPPLQSRRSRWRVVEAVYTASGKVDLHAELSLQDFLKPYTLSIARPTPPTPPEGRHTGVVLDARGTSAEPVFAPSVVGPDGAPIWRGELYDEDAVTTAPCVWVVDASHPAAARAGERPLLIPADGARDGVIELGPAAAANLRGLVDTVALGRGRVVVVVDP